MTSGRMRGRGRDGRLLAAGAGAAVVLVSVAAIRWTTASDEALSRTVSRASPVSPSSAVLGQLPDGETKRKLLLDCTACHQFDGVRSLADGTVRDEAEWREITQRMLVYGGVGTPSPLISPDRDPDATAVWLATHLTRPPEPPVPLPVPAGAEIRAFPYPFEPDLPHDIALDAEGRLLITGMFTHQMVRLDPSDGSHEVFPMPVDDANPRAVVVDDEGSWWTLLGAPGRIARYRPTTGAWDTWDIGMYGHSLRLDEAGRVWFNGHFTRHPSVIGALDPADGVIEWVEVPNDPAPEADHPMPYGLRVGPDGRVWGTELRGGRLFAYDPATGESTVHRMPEPHSGPRRPAVDGAGNVWIPEYAANRVTRFDPVTLEFRSHDLPMPDALPYVVEVDRRTGLVWVGTAAADAVLSLDPAGGVFTAYPMPDAGALIRHLVVDEGRGEVWAAYGAFPGIPPKIVRIRPGG